MKTFKIFLEKYDGQSRSMELTKEEVIAIIKKNCEVPNTLVYRGIQGTADYYASNPAMGERVSANTSNFYTLIMDNSAEWNKFPKRSKSLICTTSLKGATNMGKPYVVIPFKKAKFGVADNFDLWYSFRYLQKNDITDADEFNAMLKQFLKTILESNDKFDTSYDTLMKAFGEVDEKLNDVIDDIDAYYDIIGVGTETNEIAKFVAKRFKQFKSMKAIIEHLLDPKLNRFSLSNYKDLEDAMTCEVWTDSKCILIKNNEFQYLVKEL